VSIAVVALENDEEQTELLDFDSAAGYRVRSVSFTGRTFRTVTVEYDDVPDEVVVQSVPAAQTIVIAVDCLDQGSAGGAAALAESVISSIADPDLREWTLQLTYDDNRVEEWTVLRPADVMGGEVTPSEAHAGLIRLSVSCRVRYSPTVTPEDD
jgi:hypothetical protein